MILNHSAFAVSEVNLKRQLFSNILPFYHSTPIKFHFYSTNSAKKFPYKYFNRGFKDLIVILPGKGEQLERYAETIYDLKEVNRDILLVQFRGQGLSSRSLNDPEKTHIRKFDSVVEDLNQLFEYLNIRKKYQHISLIAHSMGGHHGIRYQLKYNLFDQIILNSPLIGILNEKETTRSYYQLLALVGLGLSSNYVPGKGGWTDYPFEHNDVSQSQIRYEIFKDVDLDNVTTRMGSVTVRWAYEAIKSERFIFEHATKIKVPIVLFQAGKELIVSNEKQNKFCQIISTCHLIRVENSMHNFLQEKDIFRDQFMTFVKSSLGTKLNTEPIKITNFHKNN